jgi:hypothetical protein
VRAIAAGKVGSSKSLGWGVSSQNEDAGSGNPSALGRTFLRHQIPNQPRRLHPPVLGVSLMQTLLFDHRERRLRQGFSKAGMCGIVPSVVQPTNRPCGWFLSHTYRFVCRGQQTLVDQPT